MFLPPLFLGMLILLRAASQLAVTLDHLRSAERHPQSYAPCPLFFSTCSSHPIIGSFKPQSRVRRFQASGYFLFDTTCPFFVLFVSFFGSLQDLFALAISFTSRFIFFWVALRRGQSVLMVLLFAALPLQTLVTSFPSRWTFLPLQDPIGLGNAPYTLPPPMCPASALSAP